MMQTSLRGPYAPIGAGPSALIPGIVGLDQVEIADAEAVVLEGLGDHRAEALPH
jgi:hypothetical protein